MSPEFKDCLARGKIKNFSPGKNLAPKELRLAGDDLHSARKSFAEGNCKWSIIQSYYSMFHSARALLYRKSYRERSHFCLIEAIRFLYVAIRDGYKTISTAICYFQLVLRQAGVPQMRDWLSSSRLIPPRRDVTK